MNEKISLDNIFTEEKTVEQKDLDVLKELFQIKNIETKSELFIKQIVNINQKRMISDLLGWDTLDLCLKDFMLLMVSNQRKGRLEFVEGFKAEREHKVNESSGGFFNRFRNSLS